MTTVLHVISGLGLGGAERMLVETAIGLQRSGLAQHVVSLRGRGHYANDLESAGVPATIFDIESAPKAIPVLWRLRQLVHRVQPGIIQGWMYHGDLAGHFFGEPRAHVEIECVARLRLVEPEHGDVVRRAFVQQGTPRGNGASPMAEQAGGSCRAQFDQVVFEL